jgi:hypothetical protein
MASLIAEARAAQSCVQVRIIHLVFEKRLLP